MQFPDIPLSNVRAITQKALAAYWVRAAAGRPFPSITEFEPEERMHDPKQLIFWQVETKAATRRYRALYQGDHVSDAFAANWTGKTLDEIVPEFARYFVMKSTDECATSGRAVYSIFRTRDAGGKAVDCERLLLPLGHKNGVEQIVASMQLVSAAVDSDRATALGNFRARIELVLAGKIIAPPINRNKPQAIADLIAD
jgi:hypothetical protein